jgi:hypothetical protein
MVLVSLLSHPSSAGDTTALAFKFEPHAFGYLQIGQIVRGNNSRGLFEHVWEQQACARLRLKASIENLQVLVAVEAIKQIWVEDQTDKSGVSLKEAQGIYTIGVDPIRVELAAGYFAFKYNSAAVHLGEYLLRCGTYPGYVINDFDFAATRLMGARVSVFALSNRLMGDVLLTSETAFGPYYDYSLSFLLGGKIARVVDLGAGISFDRLIPMDDELTTPEDAVVRDTADNVIAQYTMKGTKVMARLCFDPKPLIPGKLFGKEDLKIYAEAAILGVEDIGLHYDSLDQRIPFMVGVNIPPPVSIVLNHFFGFRLIDVAAFEMEWYTSRLNTDPTGTPEPGGADPRFIESDDVKWALNIRKEVVKGFHIKGFVGRDHYRTRDGGGNVSGDELLRYGKSGSPFKKSDWRYVLRLQYEF